MKCHFGASLFKMENRDAITLVLTVSFGGPVSDDILFEISELCHGHGLLKTSDVISMAGNDSILCAAIVTSGVWSCRRCTLA